MSFHTSSHPLSHPQSAKRRCKFSTNAAKPAWQLHPWSLRFRDFFFPNVGGLEDKRSKQKSTTSHEVQTLLGAFLSPFKLNEPRVEHRVACSKARLLPRHRVSRQHLNQGHPKSPGLSRSSPFQPSPKKSLWQQPGLSLSPEPAPATGRRVPQDAHHKMAGYTAQFTLGWGRGGGEQSILFI